jgi:hypothetical protein
MSSLAIADDSGKIEDIGVSRKVCPTCQDFDFAGKNGGYQTRGYHRLPPSKLVGKLPWKKSNALPSRVAPSAKLSVEV